MTLCHQNIHHIWRKKAFNTLLASNAAPSSSDPQRPYFAIRFNRKGITEAEEIERLIEDVKLTPQKAVVVEKTYWELTYEVCVALEEGGGRRENGQKAEGRREKGAGRRGV
jgi:hypothetical protein